jgi:hypothetical protein
MANTETASPHRIQLRRVLDWHLPAGAKSCARPHKFGNPFAVNGDDALVREPAADMVTAWEYEGRCTSPGRRDIHWPGGAVSHHTVHRMDRDESIATHRRALLAPTTALCLFHRPRSGPVVQVTVELVRRELAGLSLACYCGLDEPCHVDTLLWVANAEVAEVKEASIAEYEIIKAMAERVAALHPELLAAAPVRR